MQGLPEDNSFTHTAYSPLGVWWYCGRCQGQWVWHSADCSICAANAIGRQAVRMQLSVSQVTATDEVESVHADSLKRLQLPHAKLVWVALHSSSRCTVNTGSGLLWHGHQAPQ